MQRIFIFFLIALFCNLAPANGEAGLTGYWNFDEDSSAAFAQDLSGNGNAATFADGAVRVADRKGNAVRFDGMTAHLALGTSPWGIPATNEFSVAVWFKYTGEWSGNLLSRGSVMPFSIPAGFSGTTVRSAVRLDGTIQYVSGSTSYTPDEWYHLAITYSSGSYTIYINGDVDMESDLTGIPSVNAGNTTQAGAGLNGWIDELRIYNKKLSAVQVAALYADSSDNVDTSVVATPILDPDEGNYYSRVTVTITTFTPGATIRYTVDGSDPTASSAEYTAPLVFTSTTHLKAAGFMAGRDSSEVVEGLYNIIPETTSVYDESPGLVSAAEPVIFDPFSNVLRIAGNDISGAVLFDAAGGPVAAAPVKAAGGRCMILPAGMRSGVYLLTVMQGNRATIHSVMIIR